MVKYLDFLKKRPSYFSLYLVVGSEPFFRQEVISILKEDLLKKKGDPFFLEFSGESSNKSNPIAGDILDELKTPSMFHPHKIVVVKESKKFLEEASQSLPLYLEKPRDFSTLILEASSFDGRTKIARIIKKKGCVIQCDRLYEKPPPWQANKPLHESDLCKWIVARIKNKGSKISPRDGYIFIQKLGGEAGKIASAIDSLLLLTKGQKILQGDEIRNFLGVSKKSTSFEYLDYLIEKKTLEALQTLQSMFQEGLSDGKGDRITVPSVIATILIGTCFRKFHQIWQALTYKKQGLVFSEITSRLKINRFLHSKFQKEINLLKKENFPSLLRLLANAEKKIKSTSISSLEILEDLTLQICWNH